jgi:hypothetical protein
MNRVLMVGCACTLIATSFFTSTAWAAPEETTQSAETGIIRGVVQFAGRAPEMTPLRVSDDPACLTDAKSSAPTHQDVIVNRNNTLKNVVIYIKSGLPAGSKYPVPDDPAILSMSGCMYEPHVFALRVGQPLEIQNHDATIHNVNFMPQFNDRYNKSMVSKSAPPLITRFTRQEVGIRIKCDIHPWMLAWASAFDNPFYAVTGEDGSFEIRNVPDGEYTIEAWHETFGTQDLDVVVAKVQPAYAKFTYVNTGAKTSSTNP